MSRLLVRLLLALIMLLAAPVVCVAICIVTWEFWRPRFYEALFASELISAGLFVAAWTLVWRSQVAWTPSRKALTMLSVLWSVGIAFLPGMLLAMVTQDEDVGIVFGGLFWLLAWVASTTLIWRETARERGARLHTLGYGTVICPGCSYNMTGLREARCPECGTQYTLDELFASLAEQAAELEEAR
jgi:hypothetical protein